MTGENLVEDTSHLGDFIMLSNYAFVLILSALAFIIPLSAVVIGGLLGPKRPDPIKNEAWKQSATPGCSLRRSITSLV